MRPSAGWREAPTAPVDPAVARFPWHASRPFRRRRSASPAPAARSCAGGNTIMSIESVAMQLRTLRARIDAQTANQHSWPTKEEELAADIDRYDRRLLKAAAMLQVEAPPTQR